jgi:hypothetical protein
MSDTSRSPSPVGHHLNKQLRKWSALISLKIIIISGTLSTLCMLSYRQLSFVLEQLRVIHAFQEGVTYQVPNSNFAKRKGPRIAIMSSFVPNASANPPPRLKAEYFPHLINKACYSYIWNYDFIFNTTYGFDENYPKWHWLDFGTWQVISKFLPFCDSFLTTKVLLISLSCPINTTNAFRHRVPHLKSRLHEYDWILYTDTDFLIQDIMRPLEAFLHEFELYGKTNVQLFVPTDHYNDRVFTFSAFAFMIRNSKYGHDLLNHWDRFARGICSKGNLNKTTSTKYGWLDTDQPGLWYAMMRTYSDYFPDRVPNNNYPQCNETLGILNSHSPPWNSFFQNMMNLTKGSTGTQLVNVPPDQPYIFTGLPDGLRSGLAIQMNWGTSPEFLAKYLKGAFALHLKNFSADIVSSSRLNTELEYCKKYHGCYANYNELGELKIGCGNKVFL